MWIATNTGGMWVKYWTKPISPWASSTMSNIRAARCNSSDAPAARASSSSPMVTPISSMTTSACSWLIDPTSSPVRCTFPLASRSPACGPLPVTTVPIISTTAVRAVTANAPYCSDRLGVPTGWSPSRHQSR